MKAVTDTLAVARSNLIERISWLKPVAGLVLVVIGAKLVYDYFRS